jgi:hypothetical protein
VSTTCEVGVEVGVITGIEVGVGVTVGVGDEATLVGTGVKLGIEIVGVRITVIVGIEV